MKSLSHLPYSGAQPRGLTPNELTHFCEHGYVLARNVIAPAIIEQITPLLQQYIQTHISAETALDHSGGYLLTNPPEHPATERIYGERYQRVIQDLCGIGRTAFTANGLGYMPIRFPFGDPSTTFEPCGGHVDGNHFHHHVGSWQQGLIAVELWTDINSLGGGTAIWAGSQPIVSRLLAAAEPKGLTCGELCMLAAKACAHLPVVECTGRAGDVLFMHPHLFHGSSRNQSTRIRIAGNKCVDLRADMDLARAHPQDYSPVDYLIARALA